MRQPSKMVGAVIIAHSFIGRGLIATAEFIVGKLEGIEAVSIDSETNAFEARKKISEAIKKVDQGDGVLMMTDLFGGSPSNIAFSFLNNEKIEIVTGVNLPMILTFWNKRVSSSLCELAITVQSSGIRSIARARGLLGENYTNGRRIIDRERRLSQK